MKSTLRTFWLQTNFYIPKICYVKYSTNRNVMRWNNNKDVTTPNVGWCPLPWTMLVKSNLDNNNNNPHNDDQSFLHSSHPISSCLISSWSFIFTTLNDDDVLEKSRYGSLRRRNGVGRHAAAAVWAILAILGSKTFGGRTSTTNVRR